MLQLFIIQLHSHIGSFAYLLAAFHALVTHRAKAGTVFKLLGQLLAFIFGAGGRRRHCGCGVCITAVFAVILQRACFYIMSGLFGHDRHNGAFQALDDTQ